MGIYTYALLNYQLPPNKPLEEVAKWVIKKWQPLPWERGIDDKKEINRSNLAFEIEEGGEITDEMGTFYNEPLITVNLPTYTSADIRNNYTQFSFGLRWGFFTNPDYVESYNVLRYEVFLMAQALGISEVIYTSERAEEWVCELSNYEAAKGYFWEKSQLFFGRFKDFQQATQAEENYIYLCYLDDFSDFIEADTLRPDPAKISKLYDAYFRYGYPYPQQKILEEQARKGHLFVAFELLEKEIKRRGKAKKALQYADMGVKTILHLFLDRLREPWAAQYLYLASLTYLWCNQSQKAYDLEQYWLIATEDQDVIFMIERYFAMLLAKEQHEHFEAFIEQDWAQNTFNHFYWYYHYAVLHPNKIMAKEHYCLFKADSIVRDMENLFGKTV